VAAANQPEAKNDPGMPYTNVFDIAQIKVIRVVTVARRGKSITAPMMERRIYEQT
jgi:hypothetical protein